MRKGSVSYKLMLDLHLYVALFSSILILVLSVTGCLLIFESRIDHWLDPAVARVTPQGALLPFAKIAERLNTALPGKRVKQFDVGDADASIAVTMNDRSHAYVNPYTGEILGTRAGQPASYYIRTLHTNLLAGAIGSWIVGIATFLLLFQSISGLYLWWPLKRMTVNRKGSWLRINFDLHHALGFYTAAFVCIVCVTGLVRWGEKGLTPIVDRAADISEVPRELPSRDIPDQPNAAKLTIDDAVAIAKAQLPGGSLARIIPPENRKGSFVVSMRFPGDEQPSARSWVIVDQYSGAVLSKLDMRTSPASVQWSPINRSVHVGDILGWPTRLVVALTAIAIVIQTVSGFIMWFKRKRYSLWLGRRKKSAQQKARGGAHAIA